MFSKLTAYHFR